METPHDEIERKWICVISDEINIDCMGNQSEVECVEQPFGPGI